MSIDFARLAQQGRAYSSGRAWESEELEALITLERERRIARITAADFIRNGILTLEAYDKAVKKDFVPITQEEVVQKADQDLKATGAEFNKPEAKPRKTKEAKIK